MCVGKCTILLKCAVFSIAEYGGQRYSDNSRHKIWHRAPKNGLRYSQKMDAVHWRKRRPEWRHNYVIIMPRPHRVRALCIDGRCLSVCLSVPCLTLSRERKGIGSWKLAGRKPVIRVTRDRIKRSKGQGSRTPGRLTSWLKISHIFGTRRPRNFKLGTRMEYDDPHQRHARRPPS